MIFTWKCVSFTKRSKLLPFTFSEIGLLYMMYNLKFFLHEVWVKDCWESFFIHYHSWTWREKKTIHINIIEIIKAYHKCWQHPSSQPLNKYILLLIKASPQISLWWYTGDVGRMILSSIVRSYSRNKAIFTRQGPPFPIVFVFP